MPDAVVVMLADKPCWAFDYVARSLRARLSPRFKLKVQYARFQPRLDPGRIDLLYVSFWGEKWYKQFSFDPDQVIKEVASYRWMLEDRYGKLSSPEFVERHLSDCRLVVTPARRLLEELSPLREHVYLCPNGVEPSLFHRTGPRSGPLRIGWVGNPNDQCKGLRDIILPACESRFAIQYTDGTQSRSQVARLYNEVDVLAIASTAESQPLPLIESMACGCFPVSTNVGIVTQLVHSGFNGLVVERSIDAFARAFEWCEFNLTEVRRLGAFNSEFIRRTRSWDFCALRFEEIFDYALARLQGHSGPRPTAVPRLPISIETVLSPLQPKEPRLPENWGAAEPIVLAKRGSHIYTSKWWWLLSDEMARFRSAMFRYKDLHSLARRLLPKPLRRVLGSAYRHVCSK